MSRYCCWRGLIGDLTRCAYTRQLPHVEPDPNDHVGRFERGAPHAIRRAGPFSDDATFCGTPFGFGPGSVRSVDVNVGNGGLRDRECESDCYADSRHEALLELKCAVRSSGCVDRNQSHLLKHTQRGGLAWAIDAASMQRPFERATARILDRLATNRASIESHHAQLAERVEREQSDRRPVGRAATVAAARSTSAGSSQRLPKEYELTSIRVSLLLVLDREIEAVDAHINATERLARVADESA